MSTHDGGAAFTPGPWEAISAADGKGDFGIIADGHGELPRVVIAEVLSSVDFDGQRSEVTPANARLIAAAPDLLDVLQKAYAWLDSTGHVIGLSEEIQAAIRRATGVMR